MNKSLAAMALCGSILAIGELFANPPMPMPKDRDPMRMNSIPKFVKATGGMIEVKQPGKIFLFIDARKEKNDISSPLKKMRAACRISVELKPGEIDGSAYKTAKKALADGGAGAVAVVADGAADEPVLTAYPENGICLLNVTPLKEGADDALYAQRIHKEMWRAFSFAAGGTGSAMAECVMNTVREPKDLDAIPCMMVGPAVVGSINRSVKKFGFARQYVTTYKNACQKGIAPKPANKDQEAIWEAVQKEKTEATKEPTAPIKIKFDKKKGR